MIIKTTANEYAVITDAMEVGDGNGGTVEFFTVFPLDAFESTHYTYVDDDGDEIMPTADKWIENFDSLLRSEFS